jgi:hypothetical protein
MKNIGILGSCLGGRIAILSLGARKIKRWREKPCRAPGAFLRGAEAINDLLMLRTHGLVYLVFS